ncbi:MAG: hypothetical protein IPJ46_10585 [Anaerolineales bacterium]|nr:hypothetical protein [Anaerolineales bacterium]
MVYSSNVGDYKFPGGGGCGRVRITSRHWRVNCWKNAAHSLLSVDGEFGAVVEYKFAEEKGVRCFKMTSYYYFCQIREEFGLAEIDEYEKTWAFKLLWINIDEAILLNRSLLETDEIPQWLHREIFILEHLKHSM